MSLVKGHMTVQVLIIASVTIRAMHTGTVIPVQMVLVVINLRGQIP